MGDKVDLNAACLQVQRPHQLSQLCPLAQLHTHTPDLLKIFTTWLWCSGLGSDTSGPKSRPPL